MLTYHNDPSLKALLVAEQRKHLGTGKHRADAIRDEIERLKEENKKLAVQASWANYD